MPVPTSTRRGLALLDRLRHRPRGLRAAAGPRHQQRLEPPRGAADLKDPPVDNTDLYAFVSPDKPDTVTLIANWQPVPGAGRWPELLPVRPTARYDIKIDNNGDAKPDVDLPLDVHRDDKRGTTRSSTTTARWTPSTTTTCCSSRPTRSSAIDAAGTATTLVDGGKVAPSDVGDASMPDYGALRHAGHHRRSRAAARPSPGRPTTRSSSTCACSTCSTAATSPRPARHAGGYNVNTIALQVPRSSLDRRRGEPGHRRLEHHRRDRR